MQESQIVEIENNFRNASLGIYGTKILIPGGLSDPKHHFIGITATEDSVIDYVKADVQFPTFGDSSVTSLSILGGMTVCLGVIKNVNVQSGKVIANLITKP